MSAFEDIEGAGDPACWLSQVCEECGALIEDRSAPTCWRCGGSREQQ